MSPAAPAETLQDRYARLLERIARAERAHGRPPGAVRLLAVSKTHPPAVIAAAAALGQSAFGENYVQEALPKLDALAHLPLEWHYIGPLQSNKTRPVAERFAWVHSVDRARVAQRLSDQRPADLPPLQVCIEVNVSGEDSKAGIAPGALDALVDAVAALPRLALRGLMALPAPEADFERQRAGFRRLAQLAQAQSARGHRLDTLSMGTTADLEAAIAEGATIVRVGTALFGPRT